MDLQSEKAALQFFDNQTLVQLLLEAHKRYYFLLLGVPLRPSEQRVLSCAVSGFSCPGWRWRQRLRRLLLLLLLNLFSSMAVGPRIIRRAVVIANRGVQVATRSGHVGIAVVGVCSGHAVPRPDAAAPAFIQDVNGGNFPQGVQPAQRHPGTGGGAGRLAEPRASSGVGDL